MRTGGGTGALHANNFDFIRWLAASMVLASHEFAVLGRGGEEPLARFSSGYATFGTVGVDVFFVVSGFLVTQSMLRRGDLVFFAASRALRIFPGLLVALVVSAAVIGGIATTLPVADYLRDGATWSYVTRGLGLRNLQWTLPGVFAGQPADGVVNGSLWSLWPEMRMYFAVAGMGLLALLLRASRRAVLLVGMAVVAIVAFVQHPDPAGLVLESAHLARLAPLFAFGALMGLSPWRPRVAIVLLAVALAAVPLARGTGLFVLAADGALALGVILLAFAPLGWVARWGRFGDWSYGIYVYAFPVQQLVHAVAPSLTLGAHLAIAYPVTLMLGALSWHFVEAPALSLKRLLPRGVPAPLAPQPRG